MVDRVGLVSKRGDGGIRDFTLKVYELLKAHGLEVVPEVGLADEIGLEGGMELSGMDVDVVVTVGGDGTVLKTIMSIHDSEVAVLAVNMGRRGYLTEVEPTEVKKSVERLVKGDFWVERLTRLSVFLDEVHLVDGLNEALITSSPASKMLGFEVRFGEGGRLKLRADGVIVSTPTGSTAHAFSAGGPILHTSLSAFNMIFLCPLDPVRALVLPDKDELSIGINAKKSSVLVRVDGSFEREVMGGQKIVVRKSNKDAVFIRFGGGHLARSLLRLTSQKK